MARKRPVRRTVAVLLAFVALIAVVAVALLVWAMVDLYSGKSAAANANVEFRGSGTATLTGYLAHPAGGDAVPPAESQQGKGEPAEPEAERGSGRPAVLLLHEWWGLTTEMTELADRLAERGYIVLAPDAFRGRLAESIPGALFGTLTTPQEQLSRDIDAAYSYLESIPDVDATRIAALGFCFGATQSFLLATRVSELASVAVFYGSGLPTDPDSFGALEQDTPVLGIFGRTDSFIPISQVRSFESALQEYGVSTTVTIYPGVGHAFVSPSSIQESGAARDAWNELLRFLSETIGAIPSGPDARQDRQPPPAPTGADGSLHPVTKFDFSRLFHLL